MAVSELEGYIPVIAKSIAAISNSRDCAKEPMQSFSTSSGKELNVNKTGIFVSSSCRLFWFFLGGNIP